ncbi:MAG: acyl-CoA desaturase [Polyangiaceae bacterium]|nr:acyl-CoA desaturase [Polyangiaceae bacterium]
MAIVLFFVIHWQLSVFFQSFFLHRYGAHRQFTMSPRVERTFHFLTWIVQGSSYLNPRAYAIMHRTHHAFSDTPRDPHSPVHQPNFFKMMWRTLKIYDGIHRDRPGAFEARFDGGYPSWPLLDDHLATMPFAIGWGLLYTAIYVAFATAWWQFLLLPLHWVLGPVHGAIVNWAGHKVGYRNYASEDHSRNTLVFDVLTMGELFQNNHHKWSQSPNFAVRWFEIDPAYHAMRLFAWMGLIDMSSSQRARWEGPDGPTKAARELRLPSSAMDGE